MSSRLMLGIAAAAVAALLIGLWLLIDLRPSTAEPPPVARGSDPVAAAPATRPAERDPWSNPTPRSRIPLPVPAASGAAPSSPAPEVPADAMTPEQALHERQESTRRMIRRQMFATEQAVIDCLDKANTTQTKLSGWAAFPLTLTRGKDGKVVVESTLEMSTVEDAGLNECLRGVALQMKFEELPAGVERVSSYRKIVLKDGALHENWLGPHETVPPGH